MAVKETDQQPTISLELDAEAKRGRQLRMTLEIENQFDVQGQWLKGNLHCHLDRDWQGRAEAIFHRLGYDFVAGMDHDRTAKLPTNDTDLLVIPGAELSTPGHVAALGIETVPSNEQPVADQIAQVREQGGLCFVTHPLNGGWSFADLQGLCEAGMDGMELVNSSWWRKGDRGHSDQVWQLLLLAGYRLTALGNDDAHGPERYDPGEFAAERAGWTGVLAHQRSEAGVLDAIRARRTFASEGPVIKGLEFTEDGELVVTSSPCRVCHFATGGYGAASSRPEGGDSLAERFVFDFKTSGYRAKDFIRVVLEDEQGHRAWSSPIWFTKREEWL